MHEIGTFRICQVQMNAIIGFPKPQVAGSIPAGGTEWARPLHSQLHLCKNSSVREG